MVAVVECLLHCCGTVVSMRNPKRLVLMVVVLVLESALREQEEQAPDSSCCEMVCLYAAITKETVWLMM